MNDARILIFDEVPSNGYLGIANAIPIKGSESGRSKASGHIRTGPQKMTRRLRKDAYGDDGKQKDSAGTGKGPLISDLPLWGNFRIRDLLFSFYPHKAHATICPYRDRGSFNHFMKFLEKGDPKERIVLGRTGNITLLDWNRLLATVRESRYILKLQVGKVPSDLYVIRKDRLMDVAAQYERGEAAGFRDFLSWLFEGFLFYNFEKILQTDGFSFLFRNSYEYYRENILIADSLGSKRYSDLYGRLAPGSLSSTSVTESGEVTASVLGSGVKVEGAVKGSVLFSGVCTGKNSVIQDSVILPSNVVGEGVTIRNSLVLEGNRRIIGSGSTIGGGPEAVNRFYPDILKHGLTIIGERVSIPPDSTIGAGCLVTGPVSDTESAIDLDDGGVYDAWKGYRDKSDEKNLRA